MEKILRSKCLSLCAVFTTLILWCGVVATQQPASEILNRFNDDNQVDLILDSALKVAEKYSSDEYIDHLVNADHYKRIAQQEINEYLFARLPVSPNFEVGIYAKDFMKSSFLAAEWLLEWTIYKWCCWYAARTMFDHITIHIDEYLSLIQDNKTDSALLSEKIQEFGPYKGTSQYFQFLTDKNIIFFVVNIMIISQLTRNSKHSLLLVQEPSLAELFKVKQSKSNGPISAFTFIERHPIFSLPLDPMRGGVTTVINMMFKSCGLLPNWVDRWYVMLGADISFLLFFLTRMHVTHFASCWKSWITKSFDVLHALLTTYKKVSSNPRATVQEREEVSRVIKRYIAQGYNISFLQWMSYKVFWHSIWQTSVNCTLALPGWIKLGTGAYHLWKPAKDDFDRENDMEIA